MGERSEMMPSTPSLTPAMARVLGFLAQADCWVTIEQIGLIRLLEDDDFVSIPGLVERRLVEHRAALSAVRITPAGRAALSPSPREEGGK